MEINENNLINKNQWFYRNITGRKGVPLSKFRRVRDEIQILDALAIKKSKENKDYLEKKLANVKKRQNYVATIELKSRTSTILIVLMIWIMM